MATAVFIPPSPHDPLARMAAVRRAPLASIPNATNSPHRISIPSASKRPRAQADTALQENEPPHKRQMVEKDVQNTVQPSPRRRLPPQSTEGRVFDHGPSNAAQTAFQQKLVASREKGASFKVTKNTETNGASQAENIRQWQKQYRKMFPTFVFYFDNVSEETQARFSRHIASLGAKEEKFFSRAVSHIVTTRPIPAEVDATESDATTSSAKPSSSDEQPRTINPTLLEKNAASSGSRTPALAQQSVPAKRDGNGGTDILTRGREMGMKLWSAEKLSRVVANITMEASSQGQNPTTGHSRPKTEDLSQVLRNEKLGATSERDQSALSREMVTFKGTFIYIHDLDEKTKPIMVREYPTVTNRLDGAWPQFRSATLGKCPFVEDPATRRDIEEERTRERQIALQQQVEAQRTARTRAVAIDVPTPMMDPPRRASPRKPLQQLRNPAAVAAAAGQNAIKKPLAANIPQRQSSVQAISKTPAQLGFVRPSQMHFGGEPAASGIQRSNLTSAIQSQMISSTAAAPGARAGTSKEVHELKRKVLERNNTGSLSIGSIGSIPSSHRMAYVTAAMKNARAPAPRRAAKSKAQEILCGIQEEVDPYEDDIAAERAAAAPKKRNVAKRERDLKPGYCENCHEKYEDFEEHIVSRKHRKFALTDSNWVELDQLLAKLQEP